MASSLAAPLGLALLDLCTESSEAHVLHEVVVEIVLQPALAERLGSPVDAVSAPVPLGVERLELRLALGSCDMA